MARAGYFKRKETLNEVWTTHQKCTNYFSFATCMPYNSKLDRKRCVISEIQFIIFAFCDRMCPRGASSNTNRLFYGAVCSAFVSTSVNNISIVFLLLSAPTGVRLLLFHLPHCIKLSRCPRRTCNFYEDPPILARQRPPVLTTRAGNSLRYWSANKKSDFVLLFLFFILESRGSGMRDIWWEMARTDAKPSQVTNIHTHPFISWIKMLSLIIILGLKYSVSILSPEGVSTKQNIKVV